MPAAQTPEVPVAPRVARALRATEPKARQRVPAEVVKQYWLGTTPDSPRQNYAVGGVNFAHFTGVADFGENGQPDRKLDRGCRVFLTQAQVDRILREVAFYVVRWRDRASENQPWRIGRVGDVLDVRGADPAFAPKDRDGQPTLTYQEPQPHEPQDTPLACFLYLYEVEAGIPLPENPEPLVAR